jgi:Xaa-Pro aminopeptidase
MGIDAAMASALEGAGFSGAFLRPVGIGNCGIYGDDFGVRLEDTVWVAEQGPVSLTRHPKILKVADA